MYEPVLWIRITLMRIQIMIVTLMGMRIRIPASDPDPQQLRLGKGAGRAGHAARQLLAVHVQHYHRELTLSLPSQGKVDY